MSYTLLAAGYRPTIATLTFTPTAKSLTLSAETTVPDRASWIEPLHAGSKIGYGGSEMDDEAQSCVFQYEIGEGGIVVKGQTGTGGVPAHIHVLKNGSGIVVGNYGGGSIRRVATTETGALDTTRSYKTLALPFPYADGAPNPERQDASHAHQVIEGAEGTLYVADLGSDRVYIVNLDESAPEGLKVVDWYQCEANWGPRHMVVSADGKTLYVLGEMGHALTAFPIPGTKSTPASMAPVNILPSSLPAEYTKYMDSAELLSHPSSPRTLYVSNRLEKYASEMNPTLPPLGSKYDVPGDAVAVLLLAEDGVTVEQVDMVRTGCDTVRAMQISLDGKYVAVAGQRNAAVEVYALGGERMETWSLVARLEGVENVTDFVWA